MFSSGFVYRLGVGVKEFGERMARIKLFGVPLFRWCCDPFIRRGLAIKDAALKRAVWG